MDGHASRGARGRAATTSTTTFWSCCESLQFWDGRVFDPSYVGSVCFLGFFVGTSLSGLWSHEERLDALFRECEEAARVGRGGIVRMPTIEEDGEV